MNYCDGCDTAKHCSNTPEHKRPCQNMERQAHPDENRYGMGALVRVEIDGRKYLVQVLREEKQ